MSHDDFEPVYGLPERLPANERILWQGAPRWRSLARSALKFDLVAGYFVLLLAWQLGSGLYDGRALASVAAGMLLPALLAAAALAVLAGVAFWSARTTVYTITNRRVVVRGGIALSLSLNVPFAVVDRASLRLHRDGTGDIPLEISRATRVGYLVNWPNVRPWHFTRPQPMLRAVENPREVGALLTNAFGAATAAPVATSSVAAQGGRDSAIDDHHAVTA